MAGYDQWNPGMGPPPNFIMDMGGGAWSHLAPQSQPFSDTEDELELPNRDTDHRWQWSNEHRDFISYGPNGEIVGYKDFQMPGRDPNNRLEAAPNQAPMGFMGPMGPGGQNRPEQVLQPLNLNLPTRLRPMKPFEQPLDPKFTYVEKPKRFFSVGRIFKTAWFEPGGQDMTSRSDMEYTAACPAFYGEKPFAKFRWFVVVRKRLHHNLCFSITTFGGKGATKTSRGRPQDFVVLHAASAPAPTADPEEKITREPIGVIIEDDEQFISPLARLDCGRIYTVEDNLKVMKVGRVHPENLQMLEQYYKESVS